MKTPPCDLRFSYHPGQRERFREGSLIHEWRERYAALFDCDDERVLQTVHQRRYHFFEWLSAILLFESTGYVSLLESYTSKQHPLKRKTLSEVLPQAITDWLLANESGQPDLFVYHPITRDWFFCEVKGGLDKIRDNQADWLSRFHALLDEQDIPCEGKVRLLCLEEMPNISFHRTSASYACPAGEPNR